MLSAIGKLAATIVVGVTAAALNVYAALGIAGQAVARFPELRLAFRVQTPSIYLELNDFTGAFYVTFFLILWGMHATLLLTTKRLAQEPSQPQWRRM